MNDLQSTYDLMEVLRIAQYVGCTAIQGDYEFNGTLIDKVIQMGVDSRLALSNHIDDNLYLKEILEYAN